MKIKGKVKRIHVFIFIFIIIICFPYLNSLTHIIKDEQLNGVTVAAEKSLYSVKGYISGNYQKQYENWYLENFPYRGFLIKNYNQLKYDLFKKGSSIIGKDNYLFEEGYINEYLGINTNVSVEKADSVMQDLEVINDICKKNGKEFYFLITPSKAHFFPENIPDKYYKLAENNDNYVRYYDLLTERLKTSGIKYVDAPNYFSEVKINEPIFYRSGIHWSYYASTCFLSDFIKYINNTSNLNLRNFEIAESEETENSCMPIDTDLYDLLNVYRAKKDERYYRAKLEFTDQNNTDKKLFIQGGSFCRNLIEILRYETFQHIDYLYYLTEIEEYDIHKGDNIDLYNINNNEVTKEHLDKLLSDKDIIILEVNQEYMASWVDGFPKILRSYLEENGFPD